MSSVTRHQQREIFKQIKSLMPEKSVIGGSEASAHRHKKLLDDLRNEILCFVKNNYLRLASF